jgi:hypothetical protein
VRPGAVFADLAALYCSKNGDDRYHDEQLDEGKRFRTATGASFSQARPSLRSVRVIARISEERLRLAAQELQCHSFVPLERWTAGISGLSPQCRTWNR